MLISTYVHPVSIVSHSDSIRLVAHSLVSICEARLLKREVDGEAQCPDSSDVSFPGVASARDTRSSDCTFSQATNLGGCVGAGVVQHKLTGRSRSGFGVVLITRAFPLHEP